MQKTIAIIVITYNNKNSITKCLDSLAKQTQQDFHLLVIDNNSSDETVNIIKKHLKNNNTLDQKTELIKNNINWGFAKSVNIGLKKTLEKKDVATVLLLNPDVYFTKDLLRNGMRVFEKFPNAGAAVPKILYSDNKIWWMGTRLFSDKELLFSPKYGIAEHINKGKALKKNEEMIEEVEAMTGCALFLRVKAIKEIGLLDERYFMYVEDIDYSLRLRQKGYRLFLFTNSTVYHEVRDRKINARSVLSNLRKYTIYLKSVGLYLLSNKPWYFFTIWLVKLPYVLGYTYIKKRL